MNVVRQHFLAGAALWLILGLGWLLLSGGLGGSFEFDDSWNLRHLEQISRNPGVIQALHYILNGFSSELGRPLALATFALQYASWPHHPSDFVRINIDLHLLCGCVLFWAFLRLGRLLRFEEPKAAGISLLATALWLLAPLQASAVLYVIQRMAVLSGLFMLLGLLAYLVGRQRLVDGRPRSGWTWCTVGVGAGTVLGLLSKENAVLLPLSILVLELTLLSGLPRAPGWRAWMAAFLVAPTLVVFGYLAWHMPGYLDGYVDRGFSMSERLLTESRVLFIYLYKLVIPSISSIRLLYDDLPLSTGLLSPATTLPSVAGWFAAAALAIRHARRAPWPSFAVLWFLSNHLLESSVIPLELAFEHRNYVASIGPIALAAWGVNGLLAVPRLRRLRGLIGAAAVVYVLFLCTALGLSANLWSRSADMKKVWASRQPDSPRAQMTLADTYFLEGNTSAAAATLEQAMIHWPGDLTFPLAFLQIGCVVEDGPVPSLDLFRATAARFQGQMLSSINVLDRLVTAAESGYCSRYSAGDWYALLDIAESVPEFQSQRRNLLLLRSRVAEASGDRTAATRALDAAIEEAPTAALLAQGAAWAMQAGDFDKARALVRRGEESLPRNPLRRWSARIFFEQLKEEVEAAAAAKS